LKQGVRRRPNPSFIGDDEDSHLGDFIEDTGVITPVESATAEGLREATQNMLASLTSREAKTLRKLRHPTRSEKLKSFLDTE